MKKSMKYGVRFFCLTFAMALAVSFVAAEGPGVYDGPPDMDRKMNIGESVGGSSSAPAEHYIVALDETAGGDPLVQAAVIREVEAFGGTVYRRFSTILNGGFAATLPTRALEALQSNPHVAFVEPDAVIGAPPSQTTAMNGAATAGGTEAADPGRTQEVDWGIDRIDQRYLPLDGQANFNNTGAGSTVYILDTGIHYTRTSFSGVAGPLWDFGHLSGRDCNGHGTHIAGTVHSIAPSAQLRSVRVLNCRGYGTMSTVISGMDVILGEPGGVVTMAFGASPNHSLDMAAENLVNAGYKIVTAAGNTNSDACAVSPAGVPQTITVAATDSEDSRAPFSNYGQCVDIFAPGVSIESAWYTSDTAYKTLTGTTTAVAHVAGILVLYGGSVSALLGDATTGVVGDPGPGSPNLLLYAD